MGGDKDGNRQDSRLHIARKWNNYGESFVVRGQGLVFVCVNCPPMLVVLTLAQSNEQRHLPLNQELHPTWPWTPAGMEQPHPCQVLNANQHFNFYFIVRT